MLTWLVRDFALAGVNQSIPGNGGDQCANVSSSKKDKEAVCKHKKLLSKLKSKFSTKAKHFQLLSNWQKFLETAIIVPVCEALE